MKKLLEMKGITKYIYDDEGKGIISSGIKILEEVDFDLYPGEVHVLMGENGAGKSTLMNVLGGVIEPDFGEILINGQPVKIPNTRSARNMGIGFIHQEMNLCANIDVAHNMFMAREITNKFNVTNTREMYAKSKKMLADLGFDVDPKIKVRQLSTAMQQIVEIAKVLFYDSKIVIMDEPTSTLTNHEIEILFHLIIEMRNRGIGIIYISHRMEEIEDLGDRFTVLRDGKLVGTLLKENYSRKECIRMMAGREVSTMYKSEHIPTDEVVLEVRGMRLGEKTKPIAVHVNKSEIVGFGGLVGAGRTELAKSIFGARPYFGGKIFFNGEEYNNPTPAKSIRMGIAYLTEDRKLEGLLLAKDICENISIASLSRMYPNGLIKKSKEVELAQTMISQFKIVCSGLKQKTSTLSGGNQQKVSFGKWYATSPKLLILDEPTRGIDVNAKAQVYEAINEAARNGMAIMVITSDMHELIGISDRIYIMNEGNLVMEITDKVDMIQDKLVAYFLNAHDDNKVESANETAAI